jgi:hypothetical protein
MDSLKLQSDSFDKMAITNTLLYLAELNPGLRHVEVILLLAQEANVTMHASNISLIVGFIDLN